MHDTPTHEDKQRDLMKQYLRLAADGQGSIFCPWCLKANKPGEPACCGLFTEGVARIGQEQLQSVIRQWRKIVIGVRKHLNCPYCGKTVDKPSAENHPADWIRPMQSPFCCDQMHDAATAIIERETLERLKAQKNRIEDKVVEVGRN